MALFCSIYGCVVFHSVCIPHLLHPFICQWILRLLPCLDYQNGDAMNIEMNVSFFLSLLNYETMITHLQETEKYRTKLHIIPLYTVTIFK